MAYQGKPGYTSPPSAQQSSTRRRRGWLRGTFWSIWGALSAIFIFCLLILPLALLLRLLNVPGLPDSLQTDEVAVASLTSTVTATPTLSLTQTPASSTPTGQPLETTPTATLPPTEPAAPATLTPTTTQTPVPPTFTPTATETPVPPTSSPTTTSTPLPATATPSGTPTPTSTPVPPSATPTSTPTFTSTPRPPTATATRTPTRSTSTPTPTPVAVRPVSTRIVAPAAAPDLPSGILTLIAPLSLGEPPTRGPTTFVWEWEGDSLAPKYGFEVRAWLQGEPPAGVHDAVLDSIEGRIEKVGLNRYQLKVGNIRYAKGVLGRAGNYFWTVLVVQVSPGYTDFGLQAVPARFRYEPFRNEK